MPTFQFNSRASENSRMTRDSLTTSSKMLLCVPDLIHYSPVVFVVSLLIILLTLSIGILRAVMAIEKAGNLSLSGKWRKQRGGR
jgi:hypothetical protein